MAPPTRTQKETNIFIDLKVLDTNTIDYPVNMIFNIPPKARAFFTVRFRDCLMSTWRIYYTCYVICDICYNGFWTPTDRPASKWVPNGSPKRQ